MTEDWQRPRPDARALRRDAIVAVLLALGTTLSVLLYSRLGYYDEPAPVWLSAIVVAALTLPLALRRRHPEIVAIVISLAFFATQQFQVPELLFCNITLFMAIYSVGAWSRNRRVANYLRLAIIVAMFLWITVNLIVLSSDPDLWPEVSRSGVFSQFASISLLQFITNLLYFGGAYIFGNAAYAAARERAELVARTAELQREREHSAEQAMALDRVRIARELHDVVAHHVSVMGVQAGAARRVLSSNPAQASQSLEIIEQSARAAIDELHRLLTTLRDTGVSLETDVASQSASTRGVEQLPELVEQSTAAGTVTAFQLVGDPTPITSLVGFTLYRVTQEALTNVRKHAGDRATAEVRLRYLADRVELEITDTGIGKSFSGGGTGLGHVGMRERIAAVGGTLEVGQRSRGGYLVRASIPLDPGPARGVDA